MNHNLVFCIVTFLATIAAASAASTDSEWGNSKGYQVDVTADSVEVRDGCAAINIPLSAWKTDGTAMIVMETRPIPRVPPHQVVIQVLVTPDPDMNSTGSRLLLKIDDRPAEELQSGFRAPLITCDFINEAD